MRSYGYLSRRRCNCELAWRLLEPMSSIHTCFSGATRSKSNFKACIKLGAALKISIQERVQGVEQLCGSFCTIPSGLNSVSRTCLLRGWGVIKKVHKCSCRRPHAAPLFLTVYSRSGAHQAPQNHRYVYFDLVKFPFQSSLSVWVRY